MKKRQKKNTIKLAHEASEKLAQPVAPLALGAQIKLTADTYSKVTGKKNWLSKHSMDLTIFLGFVWGIGKILNFYSPNRSWSIWIKIVDSFFPMVLVTTAALYRLYPYINLFFKHKK